MNNTFYKIPSIPEKIFKDNVELLPSVTELFELEMAYLEYQILKRDDLYNRSAFLQSVDGKHTKHYLLYSSQLSSLTENRSSNTANYFTNGQYSTGYATHSLFPYRGKFHPQLIKGLLNIIGTEYGDTILDPMCGSGTANIEAALMGINSYALDISPFCQFMTYTKYEALTIKKNLTGLLSEKAEELFSYFNRENIFKYLANIKDHEKLKVYHLALLAYLDSMGYAKRVIKSTHKELFKKVLTRYQKTVEEFINNPLCSNNLGKVMLLSDSDALSLNIKTDSIDGVITSPPYSFAIDYAKNDDLQLEYLGYNIDSLRTKMIGLKGRNKEERLNNYFQDMEKICSEIYRVLKRDKYFVMIIGSNTNQTGGIRLEQKIIDSCTQLGMPLRKSLLKPIKGLRNTMKDEYILFFQKNN
jgi:tRNA G10  N-methylase Trm11